MIKAKINIKLEYKGDVQVCIEGDKITIISLLMEAFYKSDDLYKIIKAAVDNYPMAKADLDASLSQN